MLNKSYSQHRDPHDRLLFNPLMYNNINNTGRLMVQTVRRLLVSQQTQKTLVRLHTTPSGGTTGPPTVEQAVRHRARSHCQKNVPNVAKNNMQESAVVGAQRLGQGGAIIARAASWAAATDACAVGSAMVCRWQGRCPPAAHAAALLLPSCIPTTHRLYAPHPVLLPHPKIKGVQKPVLSPPPYMHSPTLFKTNIFSSPNYKAKSKS